MNDCEYNNIKYFNCRVINEHSSENKFFEVLPLCVGLTHSTDYQRNVSKIESCLKAQHRTSMAFLSTSSNALKKNFRAAKKFHSTTFIETVHTANYAEKWWTELGFVNFFQVSSS